MFIFQFIIFIGFILLLAVLGFVFKIMSAFGSRNRQPFHSYRKPRTINKAKHIAKKKVRPNLNERKKYSTNRSANMSTLKR